MEFANFSLIKADKLVLTLQSPLIAGFFCSVAQSASIVDNRQERGDVSLRLYDAPKFDTNCFAGTFVFSNREHVNVLRSGDNWNVTFLRSPDIGTDAGLRLEVVQPLSRKQISQFVSFFRGFLVELGENYFRPLRCQFSLDIGDI